MIEVWAVNRVDQKLQIERSWHHDCSIDYRYRRRRSSWLRSVSLHRMLLRDLSVDVQPLGKHHYRYGLRRADLKSDLKKSMLIKLSTGRPKRLILFGFFILNRRCEAVTSKGLEDDQQNGKNDHGGDKGA